MSARAPPSINTGQIVKSRGEIAREKDALYKTSFDGLEDGTIYRDPAGWKTRQGSELQKARWEQYNQPIAQLDGESIVEKWNSLQRKGFDLETTTNEIRKSLDTGSWTLPLDIIPEAFVINPGVTPMAEFMTRVTTQDDEVVATPINADPEPTFGLEAPTVGEDADGNYVYEYEQPDYDDLSYEVKGLGMATRLSDKLILASNNLRNAESTQEMSLMRGMNKKMERQIIHGTDAEQGGDDAGWDGFADLADGDGTPLDDLGNPADLAPEDAEERTRELIDEVEFNGAPAEDIAVVCDFDWHRLLRDAITDRQRYGDATEEIAAGFRTLVYDNTPIFKSDQIDRLGDLGPEETRNPVYAVNMNSTYLSMLRETTVNPLANLGPQERFGVDNYGTLTAEAPEHIQTFSVTTPA